MPTINVSMSNTCDGRNRSTTGNKMGTLDPDNWSPLAKSCHAGDLQKTTLLTTYGADSSLGPMPALVAAAIAGQVEIVLFLIGHGLSVDVLDADHWSAVARASHQGHLEVVQLLLSCGADQLLGVKPALCAAALAGQLDVVRHLVDKGHSVDTLDANNWSALAMACRRGHRHIAELLISRGSSPYLGSMSALGAAAMGGHIEIVDFLLGQGHDVHALDAFMWSALARACSQGHLKVIQRLISAGADPHRGRKPALVAAASQGQLKVVEYLVEQGCNVDVKDATNRTALARARCKGHEEVTKYLIHKGADLHLESKIRPLQREVGTQLYQSFINLLMGPKNSRSPSAITEPLFSTVPCRNYGTI